MGYRTGSTGVTHTKYGDRVKTTAQLTAALTGEQASLVASISRLETDLLNLQREVRSFLPKPFIEAYDRLLCDIFGEGKGYSSQLANLSDAPKQQLSDSYVTSNGGIRSERALNARKQLDRRLRTIAREIRSESFSAPQHKCAQCCKFIETGWKHCAWCGHNLEGIA